MKATRIKFLITMANARFRLKPWHSLAYQKPDSILREDWYLEIAICS